MPRLGLKCISDQDDTNRIDGRIDSSIHTSAFSDETRKGSHRVTDGLCLEGKVQKTMQKPEKNTLFHVFHKDMLGYN